MAGGWENASHRGDRKGMGSLYRAPPKQGETSKLLSPRLLVIPPDSADVTVFTSPSRDGVRNEVMPPLPTP